MLPVDGNVIKKNVFEGAAVEPGAVLYRLAGLRRIRIDAEVYESELPAIAQGQQAEVTLTVRPREEVPGSSSFRAPSGFSSSMLS